MTKQETASMIALLRTAYPAMYNKADSREIAQVIDLWSMMFADEDVRVVKLALKDLIATHAGYPPDIATIKRKIGELIATVTGQQTDEELWQLLKRAACNGTYGAKAEFDRLPPILQRYLGDHRTLMELALMESDIFNSVLHGQFLKQIVAIRERENVERRMSNNVKTLIEQLYRPMIADESMTPKDVNTARNRLLDRLDQL